MSSHSTNTNGTKHSRDDLILDAVREAVIRHGVRRTTANDIAEGAGISRMTFYRAMGSVDEAVLRTITREFAVSTAEAKSHATAATARERLIDFAVDGVRNFAVSPLIRSIGERDPELLVPYVTDRFGSSQTIVLDAIGAFLAEGEADGTLQPRPGMATAILVTLQGFGFSSKILAARGELESCFAELRTLLNAYLAAEA
ncbi:TetR/AcrR family transcriptional regulator [Homoserinimonas sp. A447]